jgi:Fe-coproporphyrin III synthase
MISISRLLCDTVSPGDSLRYRSAAAGQAIRYSTLPDAPRPVVVWNCTRQCNLSCIHCYANASSTVTTPEMDTNQGMKLITDLSEYGAPVLLFSGGEPLMRKDLFELAGYAANCGMRVALSTNGTLISEDAARALRKIGFAEVGISLDGIGEENDRMRGKGGAFEEALQGIRNCVSLGLRVSLRLTITGYNHREIPAIFRLVEDEGINRVCFYHLAYSGRGKSLRDVDVTHEQTRHAVDTICEHTRGLHNRGLSKEILTVGNHADGVYMYLKALQTDKPRADKILDLLKMNGGNNSGIRISSVDELGNVHPDQFWQHYTVGNVNSRKFGDIWADGSEPLIRKLRNRKALLKGRCGSCKYVSLCNGNLRVRAEAVYDDLWAEDPACYLTDEEIGG